MRSSRSVVVKARRDARSVIFIRMSLACREGLPALALVRQRLRVGQRLCVGQRLRVRHQLLAGRRLLAERRLLVWRRLPVGRRLLAGCGLLRRYARQCHMLG